MGVWINTIMGVIFELFGGANCLKNASIYKSKVVIYECDIHFQKPDKLTCFFLYNYTILEVN